MVEDTPPSKPTPSSKTLYLWGIALLAVVIVVYLGNTRLSTNQPSPSSSATNTSVSTQKFSDSPLAQSAVLIFPGSLSAAAKAATTGFTITTQTQSDGSTQVTLNATNPEYHTQQYVVKTGQKLYFIEQNHSDDDSVNNLDRNLRDDSAVVVDAQGNIVSS